MLAIGAQQSYPNGTSVIVFGVQAVPSGTGELKPGASERLLAIDIQVCAGSQVDKLAVTPAQFALELPDGSQQPGAGSGKTPVLRSDGIIPGQCIRGWVTVQAPKSPDPRYIVGQLPSYDAARWVAPKL